jgi:hypothetical protein
MPSTSKSQQRLFGWALACKRGETDNCPVNVKKLADEMTEVELEKFASTSHKDLPEKVKESMFECIEYMNEEDKAILESKEPLTLVKTVDAPPVKDPVIAPPPGYPPAKKGDPYNDFTPSLFKMPGNDKSKHERRIMDYKQFLERINYRTHDGILQDGHGQNRTGKSGYGGSSTIANI